jgi:hypothetical protein
MANDYVRVGADPEVFVKHTGLKRPFPVCGLVGGTKEAPKEFEGALARNNEEGKYAYQEDGVAFEFNIPATTSTERFANNMRTAWLLSTELLKKSQLTPIVSPEMTFKPEDLAMPQANQIGCLPDMWAYNEDGPAQRKPLEIKEFGFRRFAGGHLHLGYDKTSVPVHVMVRFIDVLVGLPSIIHDKQGMRRQYYGLPGLYREKPYGLEYRSLSNYWLKGINKDTTYLYYLSGALFDLGLTAQTRPDVLANSYKMIPWDDVKDAITQENVKLAREIFDYAANVAKLPYRHAADLWRLNPEGK